jgi:hypothetical protein
MTFRRSAPVTFGVLIAVGVIESAHATEIPRYDVQAFCRAAVEQGLTATRAACVRSEAGALATLKRRWSGTPQSKQGQCIRDGQIAMMGASYDNLLWCIIRK